MALEIVTKDDLQILRVQLINDLKALLPSVLKPVEENIQGYKTIHVRKALGCSVNKIKSLHSSGKLRKKKIGGTIYYNKEDVRKLIELGFK